MKIFTKCLLLAGTSLIIACGKLLAQVPSISYANSPASILRAVAVGSGVNPTLNVTSSGGTILPSYYIASTFAGSTAGTSGFTNATGTAARFNGPNGLTFIGTTLYVADQTNNEIRAITNAGVVTLLAGSTSGATGRTNNTGTAARFNSPRGITTDGTALYVADYTNNEIRKVTTAGVVTLLAGASNGSSGTTNANGTSARFNGPIDIVYSSTASALYVADYTNNRIRKITIASPFTVTTLAGSTAGLTNATGTSAKFNQPTAVAVDAAGNVYVADKANNQVRKVTSAGVVTTLAGNASGTAGSADGTGTAASFNAPTGITVDANDNIYVYDSGTDLLRHVTTAGVVTTIAGSGSGFVEGAGITAKFNGAGLITDASNNIYMADFGNNAIRKVTATPSFSVSPALPTGLSLNTGTGAVTGTASVSTAVTNYTITANNYSGSDNATLTLNTFLDYTWGGTTNTWATGSNWTPTGPPGPYDRMLIGLGTYSLEPIISTTETVGSILIGTNDNSSVNITVNSPGVLNVNGDITLQSDAGSSTNNAHINEFNGSGTVNAVNFKMIANTTGLANAYQLKMNSSVTNMNISGDISLLTTFASSKANDAKFTVSGGTVTATNYTTSNVTGSTSTLEMTGGTLNFTDPTALAGLSGNGTNTITLTGGTIGYTASGAQTVYTSTAITGLPSGISYRGLSFGGSGIKTAASGNLNIAGNFTNTLANDVSNYLDVTGATVVFNGTTQSLAGGSGNGTDFKNATFSGGGTKTISSGKINIANDGILTLSGSSTLAAGGFLTLKSGTNSSATVAAIPAGSSITGNVNVERYISGDQSYSRGYRTISSPVSASSGNLVWPNLTYIHTNTYTTGTGGATNGFDAVGNPTMYLYRENMAPDYSSFISGNNRGIAKINNGTIYNFNVDGDGTPFTIPAGNGLLLFFRGDRATTVNPTNTSTIAEPTTFTATGYLNQGSITVKHWTTGTNGLLYTAGSPVSVRGFNLLGNPYASSIDWDLITGQTNIGTTIWVYNPTVKTFSTYIQGNGGVGTNTNGGNVADIIPSGQGFYVKTNAASPSLTFTESHKVNTQVSAANIQLAAAPPTTDLKYIRVKLTQDADNKDDALIFFKPGTSSDYTVNEDADYLRGNNVVAISTRVNNRAALAINQMPLPAYKENINLNVIVPVNGTYQISVPETNDMPPNYDIWIKDWLKKDSVNIKTSPTYSFDAVASDSTTFKRRFSIVITTDPGSAYYLAEFKGEKQPASVVLTWKTGNEGSNTQFTIERSNDDGLTYTTLGSFTSNNTGSYSFIDNSPLFSTENLYRLKHVDISGTVAYSGTVPISYYFYNDVTKNSIQTYPNPATSVIKLKVAEIRDKNSTAKNYSDYTVTIANSQGTAIKTVNISLPDTWEGDISKLVPGVYFINVYNNNTKTLVGNSKFVKL